MRSNFNFLRATAILIVLILGSNLVNAQENKEKDQPKSSSFSPYWFLNGHLGASQYYGDLNKYLFIQPLKDWKLGGGLYVGRQFLPLLGLRGQFVYAGLGSENDLKNISFKGNYFEYNLNTTLSFVNLFSRYKPERKFDIYGFAGVGQAHYKSTASNSFNSNDSIGYDGKGFGNRARYTAIPYGLGASYAFSEKWNLTLETSSRYIGTDELDSWVNNKYDQYGLTTLGLTYKFVGGVDLEKMAREFNTIQFTTTPEVLEMHGDSVRVTIVGKVPENYFHKKAAILFQPVLKHSAGETPLKAINLLGEDVAGDGIKIKRAGDTFTYTDVIAYKPGMDVSQLVVKPLIYEPKMPVEAGATKESIKANARNVEGPEVKLADGVIITPTRILHDEKVMLAAHGYEKETIISTEAVIYFQVNMHKLNWNLPLNRNEDAKRKIKELEDFLRKGWKIRDIDINAWASPEGEESFNIGLSARRAETGLKHTYAMLRKLVKEKNSLIKINNVEKDLKYNVKSHGEDWEGFIKAVQASNIKDKNVIVNIVNSQSDVKKREQEIRNMTIVYKEIDQQILPPLRRVVIKVNAFEPKKTDQEILNLAKSDPAALNEKELLYAATLTDDRNDQLAIYLSAVKQFPNSYKGFNNAAARELEKGDLTKAAEHMKKAEELGAGKSEVVNNLGALASKKKEFKKAEGLFDEARKLGANVDYNLAMLMIPKGEYSRALTTFGSISCNHNFALAQLLAGNIAGANQNAKCAPEAAETFYLQAIIAARSNDLQSVLTNLRKAFAGNAALKSTAAKDREFIRFFENAEFKALVQ